MKKWLSWLKENKNCLSSSIALVLFYLNSIFDIFETIDISKPSAIGISTILFIVTGRSIGQGFKHVDIKFEIKGSFKDGEQEKEEVDKEGEEENKEEDHNSS
jgi:hypothetical protein